MVGNTRPIPQDTFSVFAGRPFYFQLLMEDFTIKKDIECALKSAEFIELYKEIREKHEILESFNTPQELIEFLHDYKQKHYQANDELLKILIREYQSRGKNQFIYYYLLKILTPGLNSIFYRFRKRIKEDLACDDFDLLNQIRLLLLDTLNEYDVKVKPIKIAVTIMSRIRSRLVFWYSKLKREQQSIITYKNNSIIEEPKTILSDTEYSESLALVEERLNGLVKRTIISERDSFIILATRIYGKPLKELTKEIGLSYEGLKKRRQRAEEKIRKFLSP